MNGGSDEIDRFRVEIDREADGRWLAVIPEIPGVMTYGRTRDAAVRGVRALARAVLEDRREHGDA